MGEDGESEVSGTRRKWSPPTDQWVKCNIGVSWSETLSLLGAAWVLRDVLGNVSLHSRRCFAHVDSLDEAKLVCTMWVIDNMASHRVSKVIFSMKTADYVLALERPKAWPSFGFQVAEMSSKLKAIKEWKMEKACRDTNRGANLI